MVNILIDYEEEAIDDMRILIPIINDMADYKKCILLDGCSYDIWNMVKLNKSIDEIVSEIIKQYDIQNKIEVRQDVIDFLTHLQEEGIIGGSFDELENGGAIGGQ